VGSGVQLSGGGEGGEAVEDFPAGSGGGQYSGHAFGGAGFAGGFPLHDPDGDGPGCSGPAFFVSGAAPGLGAPAGSAARPDQCTGLPQRRHISTSIGTPPGFVRTFLPEGAGTGVQEVCWFRG